MQIRHAPLALVTCAVLAGCGRDAPAPDAARTAPAAAKDAGGRTPAQPSCGHRHKVSLGAGAEFEMAAVPAGEFDMGSPADEQGRWEDEAQHHVRVARPFWIATTEVTQAIWSAVTGANPSSKEGPTLPVTDVSWEDCQDFLRRLNARVEGGGFRLPTEAEWEYACRAGATSRYAFGDDERELVGFAWYRANSGLSPQPVGTRRPNAWGLHDMHGNVWEWCEDAYAMHAEAEDAGMDAAWVAASERVMRGGGWSYPARVMRSAQRMHGRPDFRCSRLGLRLARDMEGH